MCVSDIRAYMFYYIAQGNTIREILRRSRHCACFNNMRWKDKSPISMHRGLRCHLGAQINSAIMPSSISASFIVKYLIRFLYTISVLAFHLMNHCLCDLALAVRSQSPVLTIFVVVCISFYASFPTICFTTYGDIVKRYHAASRACSRFAVEEIGGHDTPKQRVELFS